MKKNEITSRFSSLNKQLDGITSTLRMLKYACQPFADEILNRSGSDMTEAEKVLFDLPEALECMGDNCDTLREGYYDLMCELSEAGE